MGFAIPVNTAKQVADQLIKQRQGRAHAFLGVSLADATGDVPGPSSGRSPPEARRRRPDCSRATSSPKIGDKAVDGGDTVVGQVRGFKPGQQVKITYMRDGKTAEVLP